jgi:hypothetical protein
MTTHVKERWTMWTLTSLTPSRRASGIVAGVAICLSVAASASAQPAYTGVLLEGGLETVFAGPDRFLTTTVTETGSPGVESQVWIVYRNAEDKVLGRFEGSLKRGQPVTADFPLDMIARRDQVRVSITIAGVAGRKSAPVVRLEHVDAGSFTLGSGGGSCAPPLSGIGPVEPNCPDFAPTHFAF